MTAVTTAPPPIFSARPVRSARYLMFSAPQPIAGAAWPPLWWVGCHGGAGTSTLVAAAGIGGDAGRAWPLLPTGAAGNVVLVSRLTAAGMGAATGVVEQWMQGSVPPGIRLLGLVAVAASPRRPPRIAAERLRLLAGWLPAVWRVAWREEYLAADSPRDVGLPPDVDALRHALWRAVTVPNGGGARG